MRSYQLFDRDTHRHRLRLPDQGRPAHARLRLRVRARDAERGVHGRPDAFDTAQGLLGNRRDPDPRLQVAGRGHAPPPEGRRHGQLRIGAIGLRLDHGGPGDRDRSARWPSSPKVCPSARRAVMRPRLTGGKVDHRPGHRRRPGGRRVQDRQHGRHGREHRRDQAVPTRLRRLRVEVGRHVERELQHHLRATATASTRASPSAATAIRARRCWSTCCGTSRTRTSKCWSVSAKSVAATSTTIVDALRAGRHHQADRGLGHGHVRGDLARRAAVRSRGRAGRTEEETADAKNRALARGRRDRARLVQRLRSRRSARSSRT